MAKVGSGIVARSRVWRITRDAPQGEYVDSGYQRQATVPPASVERPEPGWLMSSFELACGLDATEVDGDTVPAPLAEALFKDRLKDGKA